MNNNLRTKQNVLQEYYQGNDQALAYFFKEIWNLLLRRIYYKLKNIEWSKDVLQEVILSFLVCPQELRPMKLKSNIDNLVGFFIRVAEREAINALRKKINRDRHIQQMLKQKNSKTKNSYALRENEIFQIYEEDKMEIFIQEVKTILEQRASKKTTAAIDLKVYELMLVIQSQDIANHLNLPVEKIEVIKKRVRRVMKKVSVPYQIGCSR